MFWYMLNKNLIPVNHMISPTKVMHRYLPTIVNRIPILYDGKVRHPPIFKLKAVKIKPGSFDEQLVVDWMKMIISMLKMLDHLNENLHTYGRPEVGRRAV